MKHLSLFSGIGCTELGMMLAGLEFTTVGYCEIDKYCQKVLKARMADGILDAAPVFDDVTTLTAEMVGEVDIISGGFPCQDISCAGKGAGLEGSRSGLFYEIIRLVRTLQPRYILLENVSALLARGLDVVLGTLAEAGYDAAWTSVKASDVGAPHRRERIFILCELVDTQSNRANREARRVCKTVRGSGPALPRQLERTSPRSESETGEESSGPGKPRQRQEMANPERCRQSRQGQDVRPLHSAQNQDGKTGRVNNDCQARMELWPKGYGAEQHGWEPPRLTPVENPRRGDARKRSNSDQELAKRNRKAKSTDKAGRPNSKNTQQCGETKPKLGRNTNGNAYRVDRLKALGNGIVPQQLAAALIELFSIMEAK